MNRNLSQPDAKRRSVKVATCTTCHTSGLFWTYHFGKRRPLLVDNNFLLHECDVEIKPASCRYCKASELFWIRKASKFELSESYGLPHLCEEYKQHASDWREAKRIDYAFEKERLKVIPDGTMCYCCIGKRSIRYKGWWRACPECKGIGTYVEILKKHYLKGLRRKYWPYKPHHKW